jgi:hypothetical protein
LRYKKTYHLALQRKIIQAATRLHNCVIDHDKPEFGTIRLNADGSIDAAELERFGVEQMPVANEGDGDVYGCF